MTQWAFAAFVWLAFGCASAATIRDCLEYDTYGARDPMCRHVPRWVRLLIVAGGPIGFGLFVVGVVCALIFMSLVKVFEK